MKLIICDIPLLFYFFVANMQIKKNKLGIKPEKHVSIFYIKIFPDMAYEYDAG